MSMGIKILSAFIDNGLPAPLSIDKIPFSVEVEPIQKFLVPPTDYDCSTSDTQTIGLSSYVASIRKAVAPHVYMLWHQDPIICDENWEMLASNRDCLKSIELLKGLFIHSISISSDAVQSEDYNKLAEAYACLVQILYFSKESNFCFPMDEEFLDDYLAIKNKIFGRSSTMKMFAEIEEKAFNCIQKSDFPTKINIDRLNTTMISIYRKVWNEF